ncbi:unnamed protein product [Blepharisma stoltei]|uniref:RBR-type E3 ubiquitin transferase n=1 Tax=Blepharisma stoltei TaxID=1481888 RepID=A0AAU9IQ47_9CILI|nr:unnamed protein product [Blepharisma stoltei]
MSIEPLMSELDMIYIRKHDTSTPERLEICQICTQLTPSNHFIQVKECNDRFCSSCLKSYVEFRISERKVFPIECPRYTCQNKDIDSSIIDIVDSKLYEKYKIFRRNAILEKDPNLRWCPKPNCQGYGFINSGLKISCNVCGYTYCGNCSHDYHEGACQPEEPELRSYIKENGLKECPRCKFYIEKAWGCPSVMCKCGANICMNCGKIIDINHDMLRCMLGGKYSNASWTFLLVLLFAWILFPFETGLIIVYISENWAGIDDQAWSWRTRKCKSCSYISVVLASPIISLVFLFAAGVSSGIEFSTFITKKFHLRDKVKKYGECAICVAITILVTPISIILIALAFFILNLFLPFIGLALMLMKCKRKKNSQL